eukprot:5095567-Prymnesium_polylepis.1
MRPVERFLLRVVCWLGRSVRAHPCLSVPPRAPRCFVEVKFRSETGNADTRSTWHRDKRSENGGQATLHDRVNMRHAGWTSRDHRLCWNSTLLAYGTTAT